MAKQQWMSLEDLAKPDQLADKRRDEFDEDVQRQLTAIRREYGIDDDQSEASSQVVDSGAGERRAADLRALLPSVSRRGFMRLTGAAAVFGLTGCWHKSPETLVPYRQQPEGMTIGNSRYFATSITRDGQVQAVLAKNYNGRPIKLEGNPDCPLGKGSLDAGGQASLLDLYDADRARHGAMQRQDDGSFSPVGWVPADEAIAAKLRSGTVALLTGPWNGPSRMALHRDLSAAFGSRLVHVAYSPFAQDRLRALRTKAFGAGQDKDPVLHPELAACIVTLGSDLIAEGDAGVKTGFGEQRALRGHGAHVDMGQLIAFESTLSQTGTCADLRARVKPSQLPGLAWALCAEVASLLKTSIPGAAQAWATSFDRAQLEPNPALDGDDIITHTAKRLVALKQHDEHSLVWAGGPSHTGAGSDALLLAACWLNQALGNEGATISAGAADELPASLSDTDELLRDCAAGKVGTLIIAGCNPGYDFHDQELLAKALAAVGCSVVIADRLNETARLGQWFLPTLHDLESWGDAEPRAGLYYVRQPAVLPLWDSRGLEQSLISLTCFAGLAPAAFMVDAAAPDEKLLSAASRVRLWQGQADGPSADAESGRGATGVVSWQAYVERVWRGAVRSATAPTVDAKRFWTAALTTGVVGKEAAGRVPAAFQATACAGVTLPVAAELELVLSASRTLGNGDQANNAFLQELPDPVSKITWDNYLAVSVADAAALKLLPDAVADLTVGSQTVRVPVAVQPGQAPGCVELFLGWGRSAAGAVAELGGIDDIQANGFALAAGRERFGLAATVTPVSGATYRLAGTQGHHYMDGRDIARDDVLDLHRQDPSKANRGHHHALWHNGTTSTDKTVSDHNLSLWDTTHVNTGRKWGMAIDMNACTGCNACVVACSIENNVPVVGRDEVRLGREMHWIRIDRYYTTRITEDEAHHGLTESAKVEGTGHHHANADDSFLEVLHQPMLCQQCGHAPCEEVCPAMATMHDDEGRNVQVYNRCIGTRYCANNCPYKVRRFNFYEYSKYRYGPQGSGDPMARVVKNVVNEGSTSGSHELMEAPLQMMLNPEVTVRSKGVMEKCNFCISRTRSVRDHEKRSGRKAPDSMMSSACSATCPTKAIVFGDINDPDSTVSRRIAAVEHDYKVLDSVLNTRPSVSYLGRVRNRPALPEEAAELNLHGEHGGAH